MSHAKFTVRSQGRSNKKNTKQNNNKKQIDYDESEKRKHLFMSLIQWQDRAGHFSPTDGNHL